MASTLAGEGYQTTQKQANDAIYDDLATIKAALNAIVTKLNSDTGVEDTDYAACGSLSLTKG